MNKSLWTIALTLGLATQATQAQSIADGTRYLEQEQFGNARKTLQDFYSKNQTAEAAYHLGYFYLKIDKPDSAKIYFEKGITIDGKYPLNYVGLGTTKYIDKNKAGAKADFEQAITLSKRKNADVLHKIGEAYIYYADKDPNAAIEVLEADPAKKFKGAKALAPQNPEIPITLGDAYLERNDINKNDGGKAKDNYDEAVRINPKFAKAYIKQGYIWVRARNYTRAIEDYKKGIEVDPSYSPGYRQLGDLYIRAGKYKEGIQYYEDYMKRSDGNMDTQYAYGQFLYLAKDYTKSLEVLKKLEGKFDRPNLYRIKAYDEYELKDFNNGLQSLETFFSKSPADKIIAGDYEYLGRFFIATGKDTLKGIENIHKAIELDSTKKDLYEKLFDQFYDARAFKFAVKQKELQLAKTNRGAASDYVNMGLANFYLKDHAKADSAFSKSIRIQENVANTYWKAKNASAIDDKTLDDRDRAEKDKKDPKTPKEEKPKSYAKSSWERYIALAEKDIEKDKKAKDRVAEGYYRLATAAASFDGDLKKAEELAKKSLEIKPDLAAAKDMLERIEKFKKASDKTNQPKPEEKRR